MPEKVRFEDEMGTNDTKIGWKYDSDMASSSKGKTTSFEILIGGIYTPLERASLTLN